MFSKEISLHKLFKWVTSYVDDENSFHLNGEPREEKS